MIKRVITNLDAKQCDELLTKLILDERKYDKNIDENFIVKDYFKSIIQKENHYVLAYFKDNIIVGYIYLKPIETDNKLGYLIDGLYVLEEYRNQKIAKSLILESLNILAKLDIEYIDINVMWDNEVAKNLYKYLGFDEFKIQMRKYI